MHLDFQDWVAMLFQDVNVYFLLYSSNTTHNSSSAAWLVGCWPWSLPGWRCQTLSSQHSLGSSQPPPRQMGLWASPLMYPSGGLCFHQMGCSGRDMEVSYGLVHSDIIAPFQSPYLPSPRQPLCAAPVTTHIHTCLSLYDPSSPTFFKCLLQPYPYPHPLSPTHVSPAVIYSSHFPSLAHGPGHTLICSSHTC